jgi:hypothetical protein
LTIFDSGFAVASLAVVIYDYGAQDNVMERIIDIPRIFQQSHSDKRQVDAFSRVAISLRMAL